MFQATGWEESNFSLRLASEAAIPVLLLLLLLFRSREEAMSLSCPVKACTYVRPGLGRVGVGAAGPSGEVGDFDHCFCSVLGKRAESSFRGKDLRASQGHLWVDAILCSSRERGTKYSASRSPVQSRIVPTFGTWYVICAPDRRRILKNSD